MSDYGSEVQLIMTQLYRSSWCSMHIFFIVNEKNTCETKPLMDVSVDREYDSQKETLHVKN